jgi:serine/threonine protein kinase
MDHYRLHGLIGGQCEGHKHISAILECAYPPINESSKRLYEELEDRGEKMFFSQEQLKKHFIDTPEVIEDLLSCGCPSCTAQRGTEVDRLEYIKDIKDNHAWLLLPIMIYLGKLHFAYPWIRASRAIHWDNVNRAKRIHHPVECSQVIGFDKLLDRRLERKLFKSAYARVRYMFSPVVFSFPANYVSHPSYARFPFHNDEGRPIRQGQAATVDYFEVPREYVDNSIKREMEKSYPKSILGGRNSVSVLSRTRPSCQVLIVFKPPRYCFVRKALKTSRRDHDGMHRDVLRMVSGTSQNIITLMAIYEWRDRIYHVFPFVSSTLSTVLREAEFREILRQGHGDNQSCCIVDCWLWKQLLGVAEALSIIHSGIYNPFPGDDSKVIAFHFDLTPGNILVTEDRELKIADFGNSRIRVIEDGEEECTFWSRSDLVYIAPEAYHNSKNASYTPGGGSRHVKVLLNYDVWALACIVLEVLVFLTGGTTELETFDREREQTHPGPSFFDSRNSDIKDCVRQRVISVSSTSNNDETYKRYLQCLRELLLGDDSQPKKDQNVQPASMLAFDKDNRLSSAEVTRRLHEADKAYRKARGEENDPLRADIRNLRLPDQKDFREVGWRKNNIVESFINM